MNTPQTRVQGHGRQRALAPATVARPQRRRFAPLLRAGRRFGGAASLALLLSLFVPGTSFAVDANEPNDTWEQATPLAFDTPVRGELPDPYDPPELDYFSFRVPEGRQTVTAIVDYWEGLGDPPGTGDCAGCVLGITFEKRPYGFLTGTQQGVVKYPPEARPPRNADGSYTAKLSYTFTEGGVYTLELMGGDGGVDRSYRVTIVRDGVSGTAPTERLAAIGDSVTAGFGYRDDGTAWGASDIVGRCNLFGPVTDCQAPTTVSWPRFLADGVRLAGWENAAQSGSTPADWATGGLRTRLDEVTARAPTLVGLTLGANPILRWLLFEADGQACLRVPSESLFYACLDKRIEGLSIRRDLGLVYRLLLRTRAARVYAFRYHEATPVTTVGSSGRVGGALRLLNDAIDKAVADVQSRSPSGGRLRVVVPGDFSRHGCMARVPWVLDTDTCIHPNADGMRQYASALISADRVRPWYGRPILRRLSASRVGRSVRTMFTLRRPAAVTVRLAVRSPLSIPGSSGWRLVAVRRGNASAGAGRALLPIPLLDQLLPASRLRVEAIARNGAGRVVVRVLPVG